MYKLLIMDDEPLTLEYLVNCMDYAQLGLELIGTCMNGNEGLEKIYLDEPDVVMMDIKMPGMTGIEVLQSIQGFESRPEVIFVSGHSDFQYTQKALQYSAADYILKPINESNLAETLRKAIEKVKQKNLQREEKKRLATSLRDMQASYEYFMFKNYLFGLPKQPLNHVPPVPLVAVQSTSSHYAVLALTCACKTSHSMEFIFDTISDSFFAPNLQFFENDGFLAIVLQMPSPQELQNKVLDLARSIESELLTQYGIELSAGAGSVCHSISEIHASYLQAQRVLLYKAFLNTPKILFFDELDFSEVFLISNVKNTLHEYLQVLDRESIDTYLQQVFSSLEAIEYSEVIRSCAGFWSEIIIELNNLFAQTGREVPISVYDLNEMVRMINAAPSILGIYEVIKQVLALVISKNTRNLGQSLSRAIKNAVMYIDENCTHDITLNDVAHHVYLSNSRFSTVFSEEVGEPFSKYLTQRRIEKAKGLMQNPYAKIYEISDQAGFKDPRYFSTVFKKIEGVTPVQYMRCLQ